MANDLDCLPQMFSMNKYIGAHVEPYKPVDLNSSSAAPKKRKAKSSPKEKPDGKKKAGTQAPYRLSDALVAVVGKPVLPRPQVTQALWAYIRENSLQVGGSSLCPFAYRPCLCSLIHLFQSVRILQNPQDKREIICDKNLSMVMGGQSKVTMFSMNKYITPHLLEKLDKSEYNHEDGDGNNYEDDCGSFDEIDCEGSDDE